MASGSGLNSFAPGLLDTAYNMCNCDCLKIYNDHSDKGKKIKLLAKCDAFVSNSMSTKKLNTEKRYMKMRSKQIESARRKHAQTRNRTGSGYKNGWKSSTPPSHKICSHIDNRWHWQPLAKVSRMLGLKNIVDKIRQLLIPEENTLVDIFDLLHPEAFDPYRLHSNTTLSEFNLDAMGSMYCLADDNPYFLTGDSDRLLEYEIVKRWQAKSLMSTILLNDTPQPSRRCRPGNRQVASVSTTSIATSPVEVCNTHSVYLPD